MLLRQHQLSMLETATEKNQNSLYNTIYNTQSITQAETKWLLDREDLVALVSDQERSLSNTIVEEGTKSASRTLARALFRTKDQSIRTGSEKIDLYSHKRLDIVTNILITIAASFLLMAPVAILDSFQSRGLAQIAIIWGFVLLFALCTAIFTNARKQEVFTGTAAYAAVLVVFLSNNNPSYINTSP